MSLHIKTHTYIYAYSNVYTHTQYTFICIHAYNYSFKKKTANEVESWLILQKTQIILNPNCIS